MSIHLPLILLNVLILKSQCFIILSHRNSYTSNRYLPLYAFHKLTVGQKMEKIHHINCELPIRRYEGDSPEVRMMQNTLKQKRRSYLDKLNAEKLGIKVRKRHKGGRMDKVVNERLATCTVKYLLLSPIKLTKILKQIKKMPVLLAMGDLAQRGSNRYALAIYKAIKSALFNAKRLYGGDSTNLGTERFNISDDTPLTSIGGYHTYLKNNPNTSLSNYINTPSMTSTIISSDCGSNKDNTNTNITNNSNINIIINSISNSNQLDDSTKKLINTGVLKPKFKELSATKGGYIKKPFFRAKGRCDIIRKPKAHLRVVLSV